MSSKWRFLLTIVVVATAIYLIVDKPIQLGLDLEGGTQVVLDLKPREGQQLNSGTANETLEVMRRRVDSLGVAEPNLEVAGDKRIIVELPGVTDPTEAVKVIGSTAQLTFHSVTSSGNSPLQQAAQSQTTPTPADTTPTTAAGLGTPNDSPTVLGQEAPTSSTTTSAPTTTAAPPTPTAVPGTTTTTISPLAATRLPDGSGYYADDAGQVVQLGPTKFTGDGVKTATAQPPDPNHTSWYIQLEFKDSGSKQWKEMTAQAACASGAAREVAIVLDETVISHPPVSENVVCGEGISGITEITGQFSSQEAKNLALLIRGGALPVDVQVASQQIIGPELGKAAINASRDAVIIGGILTMLYILLYYRLLGAMASISLAIFAVVSFASLIGIGVTLTLPGIAGLVLGIAMAMDSNVLVFERVKEEFAAGRSLRAAANVGFKNALSAIIDSNATTFIAALTLYFFAVGEVKGFGITLLITTAISIFVTLIVLRTLVTGLLSMKWAAKRPRLLGLYVGNKFRQRMTDNPPNLMRISKYVLVYVGLVTVFAIGCIAVKGINYGIEFTGGRLIEYKTTTSIDIDKAREKMGELGFPRAVVQRSGTEDTSIRVPELTAEQLKSVDDSMAELGGGKADKLRDETIGPSFGQELKRKAIIGLIIGLSCQLLYVAWRFRWTFGVGAVVGMIHDSLLVVGLFALLQKPFDAVFLAALLTIIAFSVNDSVVVFDRIREQRRRRISEDFAHVVSDACAQTFPRTLNISLSAIFILLALWLLGGQTLGDFALALVLGVITGVYSSVFIASPIAVLLERWKPSMSSRSVKPSNSRKPAKVGVGAAAPDDDEEEGDSTDEASAPSARPSGNRPTPRPRKKKRK